jgi:hypothetical protein
MASLSPCSLPLLRHCPRLINPDPLKLLGLQQKKLRGKSLNRIASPKSGLYQVRLSGGARGE